MRLPRFLVILCVFAALQAAAQTNQMTSIVSTRVLINGAPVNGVECYEPVNANGAPIALTLAGGGYNVQPSKFCGTLTAGALAGALQVPDSETDSAPGHGYALTIYNSATGATSRPVVIYGITGSTWSLDSYVPSVTVPTTPALTFTSGSGSPTGSCVAPAIYYASGTNSLSLCGANGQWQPSTSGASTPATSALLKGNGTANGVVAAVPGTDYLTPAEAQAQYDPVGAAATAQAAAETAAPSIPATTALLKGSGSTNGVLAATAGTDYLTPAEAASAYVTPAQVAAQVATAQAAAVAAAEAASGSVGSGNPFAIAFYPATGTTVSGATPFNGIGSFSTNGPPTAATAADIENALGTILPSGDATGVTDAAAIQAKITAGTPVRLTGGIYYLNGPETWNAPDDLHCDSLGRTLIEQVSPTADTFDVSYGGGSVNGEPLGMTIDNCTFTYKSGVTPTAGVIFNLKGISSSAYLSNLHIENNLMYNVFEGFYLGSYLFTNFFKDNHVDTVVSPNGACMYYNTPEPGGDANIDGLVCDGTTPYANLDIYQSDTNTFSKLKVNGGSHVVLLGGGVTHQITFIAPSIEGANNCAFAINPASGWELDNIQIVGGEVAAGSGTLFCGWSGPKELSYQLVDNLAADGNPGLVINWNNGSIGGVSMAPYGGGSKLILSAGGAGYIAYGGTIVSAYAAAAGQWFTDTQAGENIFTAGSGKCLRFGGPADSTIASTMQVCGNSLNFGTKATINTSGAFTGTSGTFTGAWSAAQYLGPAADPTGTCSTPGAYWLAQTGHMWYCPLTPGSSWVEKF